MVKIIDPIFLKKIDFLKGTKPQNYQYREIDLFVDEDVVNKEIRFQGNVLDVGKISVRAKPIYVRFNETLNDAILLEEGIYLFDFYRIFLTFRHAGEPCSIILIASKDLIKVNYPARIQKPFDLMFPYDLIAISGGSHVYPIKYTYGYNQIRGFAKNDSDNEQKIILSQYGYEELLADPTLPPGMAQGGIDHEIIIPANSGVTFIIDLIGCAISWVISGINGDWNCRMFAELWCI